LQITKRLSGRFMVVSLSILALRTQSTPITSTQAGRQRDSTHKKMKDVQTGILKNVSVSSVDDLDVYALAAYDAVLSLGFALEKAYSSNIDPTDGEAFIPVFNQVCKSVDTLNKKSSHTRLRFRVRESRGHLDLHLLVIP
jgi:hypothetical protein